MAEFPLPSAAPALSESIAGSSAPSALSAGEVVAQRFEVQGLAGQGGMGLVYRALDRQTGRLLALKLLLDAASEQRFAREARVLANLDHPGIVRYVAHGATERGGHYLAMEWLDGADLRARLANGGLSLRDSLSIVRGAAEALAAAHERGIVHRDVNPRNLFLVSGEPSRVKVLDFGIARPVATLFGMTLPGTSLGTPGYMAPEQARGGDEVDPRADVFSLGCVLYECLTGMPAFAADNLMALLSKVLFEDAPRLSERGDFPAALDILVGRMLAKNAAHRPRDGAQVAAEISSIAVDETPGSGPQTGPRSITSAERRLICVVMAAESPAAEFLVRDGLTLASSGAPSAAQPASLARFGAKIERLADGTLVATLVGDGDATDHAARAARFALALRDILPTTPVALATGRGIVTGRIPVGEVLDRVSHLLLEAKASHAKEPSRGTGTVRIDDVTAGLLDLRFHVVEDGDRVELRGTRESHDASRSVLGKPTSCVGRERDLRTLEATFDECVEESAARIVLVTAPAGYGKTRLRREFLHRVRERKGEVTVLLGRGDPIGAGAPFGLIAQTVTDAAAIADGEPLARRREKLAARVGATVPPAERMRVAEFLGELVGAPFPQEESVQLRAARQDPVLRGDQIRRAYEDWLRAETSRQPVMLVFDDLHWGDLPSVKVVDAVLRNLRDAPLMVLASARPDVHDLFPDAWSQRGLVELRLTELTPRSSEKLVREVLGERASAETVSRIVEKAAGNPFFLEELLRAEAEGKSDSTPASVLAVVSARVERLEAGARRVLRAASVFGRQFWASAVTSLLGAGGTDTKSWLDYLTEREVVARRGRGKFPGEDEYFFRHALLREAAYAMLPAEDRVLGHRLAAAWLEEAGERDALTLAEHFDRGQAPDRAVAWYQRAAEQALEGNDLDAATRHAERAVGLGAEGIALAAALQIQAEAHKWRGANAQAAAAAHQAMGAAAPGTEAWFAAAGEVVAASGKLGDRAALANVAEALLASPVGSGGAAQVVATARAATQLALVGFRETGEKLLARLSGEGAADPHDPAVAGWVLEARAVSAGSAGDPGARVRFADAAAASFETAGDLRNACLQRVSLGYAYCEIGAYAQAERSLRGALAVAERMGLDNAAGTARAQLGRTLAMCGKLDEADAVLTQAIEALRAQKNLRLAAISGRYRAHVLTLLGDLEGAEREARAAVAGLTGTNALLGDALASLALAQRERGAIEEALATAGQAVQALEAAGKTAVGEAAIRLENAESLFASGQPDAARAAIATAKERLLARAATLADPELRHGFLTAVAENARTLELAAAWGVG